MDEEMASLEAARAAVTEAAERHFLKRQSLVVGMDTVYIDRDVRIAKWGKTINEGLYHLKAQQGDEAKDYLFESRLAPKDDGEDFALIVEPCVVSDEREPLVLSEVAAWAAAGDAHERGDDALARAILHYAYHGPGEPLARIKSSKLNETDYTTDKVNSNVWRIFEKMPENQLAMAFDGDVFRTGIDTANAKDKQEGQSVITSYSIDYSGLEGTAISKRLTAYDKRVYEACSSLWRRVTEKEGQDCFSLTDIHYAMGFEKKPGVSQKKKLNDSLTKLSTARLTLDNAEEAERYGYDKFVYDGQLLQMDRITCYSDGQLTDAAVRLFREPPLFSYASKRKQISSYSIELLRTPISKTERHLAIEDYLREQITWMRHSGKRSRKMKLETILREGGVKSRAEKQRQKKTIAKILDHYTECGFIAGYETDDDGYTIKLKETGMKSLKSGAAAN